MSSDAKMLVDRAGQTIPQYLKSETDTFVAVSDKTPMPVALELFHGAQIGGNALAVTFASDETFNQFPPTLGEQDLSASISVTPGTRAIWVTSNGSLSSTLTPQVSTSAYTANFVVGGKLSFGAVLGARGMATLASLAIKSNTAMTDDFTITFFNADPAASTFINNTLPILAAADVNKRICAFQIPATASLGSTLWCKENIGKLINGAVNGGLWAVITRAGTTAFATTAGLEVTVDLRFN